jgi:hypothetical protein
MTVLLLLLQTLITSKQVATLKHDQGLDRPVSRQARTTRHPKTSPPQPKGGREDRGLQMWRLAQKMLSLAQHPLRKQTACLDTIEGVERQFSELSEPPRPPISNFHLIRGGEGKMCGNFGGGWNH